MSEDELARLAREEILKEARSGSERAEQIGPQGWMKCPIPPANKRFLTNTIIGTLTETSRSARKKGDFRDGDHRKKSSETLSRHQAKTKSKDSSKEEDLSKNKEIEKTISSFKTHDATKRKSSNVRHDIDASDPKKKNR